MMWPALLVSLALAVCSARDVPSDYCQDMALGGYKRHPYDCRQYVSCWSPGNFYVLSCQPGLLYDHKIKTCNYEGAVQCATQSRAAPAAGPPTVRAAPKPHRPVPRTTEYHRPVVVHRTPTPSKTVHAVHREDLSNFVKVVKPHAPAAANKPDCKKDGLYSDPRDCTRYYICSYGASHSFSCPQGTFFHDKLQRCEFKSTHGQNPCQSHGAAHAPRPAYRQPSAPVHAPRPAYRQPAAPTHAPRPAYRQPAAPTHAPRPAYRQPAAPTHAPRPTYRQRASPTHARPQAKTYQDRNNRPPASTGDMMTQIRGYMEESKRIARDEVKSIIRREARMAGHRAGQRSYSGVAHFLGATRSAKKMSLSACRQLLTLHHIKNKFHLNSDQLKQAMKTMPQILAPNPSVIRADMNYDSLQMDMDTCPFPTGQSYCDSHSRYRTMDGSCNNLQNPLWGRSMTPFVRLMDPVYCDYIDCPRRSKRNQTLPSARLVSRNLFTDKPDKSNVHTVMLMTTGQFLDHDITKTALTMVSKDAAGGGELSEVTCGTDGCSTEGDENRACLPIDIPPGDPAFKTEKCLMFVRTLEVPNLECKPGPRQQLNQLTHYIDGSQVYGSTKEEGNKLRRKDSSRGLLAWTNNPNPKYKPLLPQGEDKECVSSRCFNAGDERVNENSPLTSLHTAMMRIHNTLEAKLHKLNPSWSGERLYQETRKIVGAMWQHCVYNEYLPTVLGPQTMARYGLTLARSGFANVYDRAARPEIANVFASAAFRFSHSMIIDDLHFSNQDYSKTETVPFNTVMRRTTEVFNNNRPGGAGVDSIMHGIMSQRAMQIDRHFSKQITQHLFTDHPPNGLGTDLTSLNIQRARDHGVPGYNAWRRWCGLPAGSTFRTMPDIKDPQSKAILEKLYDDVEDVDLFAGAMSERHVPGGVVGPTFACIVGRQFRNSKVADRFWYESRNKVTGFTLAQLTEIRKVTLSKLICMACDKVDVIQKYIILQPIKEAFKNLGSRNYGEAYSLASLYRGDQNTRRKCTQLPDMDFSKWKDS